MKLLLAAASAAILLLPASALACACGCGVFDVGGDTMVMNTPGVETFLEYDEFDQTQNWSGTSKAPAANDTDKRITTNFVVLGARATINANWGVMVEVPVTDRTFRTTDPGVLSTFRDTSLGDVRVMAVYTGFSKDGSTGVLAGLKIPTGDYRAAGFTRDVEIGTGSTNVLFGGYHTGALGGSGDWSYLVQALADVPVAQQGDYWPGAELDASASVSYAGWSVGGGKVRIEPLLQLIGSLRASDGGREGDRDNTGYTRVLLSPGLQVSSGGWKAYGDVEIPVYQDIKGNQLISPVAFKVVLSRAW